MKRWVVLLGISPCCLGALNFVFAEPVDIQTGSYVDYTQTVAERPVETAEEARFFRMGSWKLTPRLELSETFDSNIYIIRADERDDFITKLKPTARLESDWDVHSVMFEAGGDIGWYSDFSSENYQDYYVTNRNRLEVVHDTALLADVLVRQAHTPRASPDVDGRDAEPITYNMRRGSLGFERNVGLVGLKADIKAEDSTYADTDRLGGGTIDNAYRDLTRVDGGFKLTYNPEKTAQAYLTARVVDITYDDSRLGGRTNRNNSGYDLTVGARRALSDIWVFDASLGYAPRMFRDRTLNDIGGGDAIVLSAKALWNPTPVTSVVLDFKRQTFETIVTGASALVDTNVKLRLEHKLTEALVLDSDLSYTYDVFSGTSREDDVYRLGLGGAYFFTKFVSARASYGYRGRSSSDKANDYDRHVASLQLKMNY